jgi:hypothetical protein
MPVPAEQYWIDYDTNLIDADSVIHSGITVNTFNKCLERAYYKTKADISGMAQDPDNYVLKSSTGLTAQYWYVYPEISILWPWTTQVNDYSPQQLSITMHAKAYLQDVDVRCYLLPKPRCNYSVETSNPYPDDDNYFEWNFTAGVETVSTSTKTPTRDNFIEVDFDGRMSVTRLGFIIYFDSTPASLQFYGMRVAENLNTYGA